MSDNKQLFLPTLKTNLSKHPVFINNTKFIANTKAFYEDLNSRLEDNEDILNEVIMKSQAKISKANNSLQVSYSIDKNTKGNDDCY
jgi:hypothetical protein